MLLVADIGNSQITIGVYDNNTLLHRWGVTSRNVFSDDEYGIKIINLLGKAGIDKNIDGVIISSVVSHITNEFKSAIIKYLHLTPVIVNHHSNLGDITVKVDNPQEVGPDRLCNIVGAISVCKAPLVVVDMGTATTFDILNKDAVFVGGTISPGVGLSLKALSDYTSLLPDVQVDHIKNIIATNTVTNMLAGTVIAHAAMVEGMLERVEKELGTPVKTIATGGYSIYVEENMSRKFDHKSPQLTLDGLSVLYDLNT